MCPLGKQFGHRGPRYLLQVDPSPRVTARDRKKQWSGCTEGHICYYGPSLFWDVKRRRLVGGYRCTPRSAKRIDCLTLEERKDKLSENVDNQLPTHAA